MRLLAAGNTVPRARGPIVATVGVFDGVHLAHQQLIRTTVHYARQWRGTSVVVTFDPDPAFVLDPHHAQPALMSLAERLSHIKALGVDWVLVIPFTRQFSRITPTQFIRRVLTQRLHASALVVGRDFLFGHHRQGNLKVLQQFGPRYGVRIIPVPLMIRGGMPVSSSRIRHLIHTGHVSQSRQLLGRPPALSGTVVQGAGRGRRLGFPTANVRLLSHIVPPDGVYAVIVRSAHRQWRGVMNLGVRPTFGPGTLVCEVHLLGFSGTLLHRQVTIALLARLRNERCFESPQALVRQIQRDLTRARRIVRTAHQSG